MKQNDSRNIQRSMFRKCNVVKMTMLPKFINKFNAISIKILTGIILKELHLLSLKIYFVRQGVGMVKTKVEDWHYLISKLIIKLLKSRQCDIDVR